MVERVDGRQLVAAGSVAETRGTKPHPGEVGSLLIQLGVSISPADLYSALLQ